MTKILYNLISVKLNKKIVSIHNSLLFFKVMMYKIHFVNMKKFNRIKKKFQNYLYDHIHIKEGLNVSKGLFIAAFSAVFYAFAFYCFITPTNANAAQYPTNLAGQSIITGGVGGITQVLYQIIHISGGNVDPFMLQSICYFAFNIPILAFAYFKIGKKFALLSLVNVGLSSLFIQLFDNLEVAKNIASILSDQHITRVLFAGICIGIASASAFKSEISCGGIDVFSYYFSLRKSTSVGKYATAINSIIITVFSILTIVGNHGEYIEIGLLNFMFGVVYLVVTMLVVDLINIRNKKVQLQIISSYDDLTSILIANFPHSTTIVKAKGGYSRAEKTIVYMVVSSNEVKRVINLMKKVDPHSFITVTSLVQAYGNFYIKPIE